MQCMEGCSAPRPSLGSLPPPLPHRRSLPFCSPSQYIHRMDVSITRRSEGKVGRTFVGDMSEDRAVQLASKVVSEGFLYGVSPVLPCCGTCTVVVSPGP